MQYCHKCNVLCNAHICPICGNRQLTIPKSEDFCFLVEKEMIWGEMLADVLQQNQIPFTYKPTMGAGLTMKVGPAQERYRFFVPYSHWMDARDIVDELFCDAGHA